jgi:hypothetical protein
MTSGQHYSAGAFWLRPENRISNQLSQETPTATWSMVAAGMSSACQRLAIGRSAAGVPRYVPLSSLIAIGQASGCTAETQDAAISGQYPCVDRTDMRNSRTAHLPDEAG